MTTPHLATQYSGTRADDPVPASARRLCMLALMSAAMLASLDTTIANTALPHLAGDLRASEAAIIWVANAYQIAMIALLLPCAGLGESVGYRPVFISGLALFAAASALCGVADTLALLLAGRAVQGLGAAAMMSVMTAFIRHVYSPGTLGRGLGLHALMVAIGFTLGPVVASLVLAVAGWHWLFLINVPIATASIGLALRYLPQVAGGRHRFALGAAGLCGASLGLFTLGLCMIENGGGMAAGLSSLGVAGLCLAGLLRAQRGDPAPMLPVDLLRIRAIRLSSLTAICAFATQSLALVALPFFLQRAMGVPVVQTGFLLAAWPLVVALMALVAAPLSDRYPAGYLCSAGLLILTAGMAALSTMPPQATSAGIALRLALCGLGFGLFQAPNMREIVSRAPAARSGGAGGVVALSRLLGQTGGAALVAQCFHWSQAGGPVAALWLGAASALLGCAFSALRLRLRR